MRPITELIIPDTKGDVVHLNTPHGVFVFDFKAYEYTVESGEIYRWRIPAFRGWKRSEDE